VGYFRFAVGHLRLKRYGTANSMKALIDEAAARATKTKIRPFGIKLFDMPENMERFQA
jgi:hypothetical protein